MEITIRKTTAPRVKPSDETGLGFGRSFTDHMFIMDYTDGKGWHDPRIVPYGPLALEPSTMTLHYGQTVFEGLKAYRTKGGDILLFRPEKNMERLNVSNERLCIPQIDVDFCVKALKTLVDTERDWVPSSEGTSLYLRPFIIATDPFLGVHPSHTYQFIVICSPSGQYYPEGVNPVKIWVESKYVRAVKGGVGYSKTAANYAASLKAQQEAEDAKYTQVLWLDGVERKYIEEVGTMNVFFVINGEVITPRLQGSILPGITRMSVIELLRAQGRTVTERAISIQEVYDAHTAGTLEEAFGTGTAAVISPIGELNRDGEKIILHGNTTGPVARALYNDLTGIQSGEAADTFGWTQRV
ncbi:MAG: branched-chain amino acid aminotransferase [Clostridiales bacterium]|jgi:branched-chain amino acid aminotransferase|nr:branched-chain amino acid aminotransferase [Clostridiales bacterium]